MECNAILFYSLTNFAVHVAETPKCGQNNIYLNPRYAAGVAEMECDRSVVQDQSSK